MLSLFYLALSVPFAAAVCTSGSDTLLSTFSLQATSLVDGSSTPLVATIVETQLRVSWLLLSANLTSSYPVFTLESGVLKPHNPSLPQQTLGGLAVSAGTSPSFMLRQFPGPLAPVYCVDDSHLVLNNFEDKFSLCVNTTTGGNSRRDLVWKAEDSVLTQCEPVSVNII